MGTKTYKDSRGVFTVEVFDIWNHNSDNIIEKIKGMINTWSRRKFDFDKKVNYHKVINVVKICLFILSFTKPARCLTQIFRANVFLNFYGTRVLIE